MTSKTETPIKKVAVIGAGVMGAGIAAHVANAGIPVVLLDIVPEGAANRNAIAEDAVQKMLKADPAPFMHKRNAKLIQTGNIEDHLDLLADCDWIVEAVIERLDIKQSLYAKIDGVRKAGSVVSSNTSTIPLATLTEGLPDGFKADFCITHFFNPPRYMRLLELVTAPETRTDAATAITEFCDHKLGKSVVVCKDRPGFIANRLGILWLLAGVTEARRLGLTVEEADAIIGRPFGIPKTGVFGLIDLVGLDLMPHVLKSMVGALPETDAFFQLDRDLSLVEKMIAEGYTGRKGKGGFYRINRAGGAKVKEAIDLQTGEYRPTVKPALESIDAGKSGGAAALLTHSDKGGRYARAVMARTLAYAAALVPEAADEVYAVDEAMRLGYNWKQGPFELIDKIGADTLIQVLKSEGMAVPTLLETAAGKTFYKIEGGTRLQLGTDGQYREMVRPDGVVMLADIKLTAKPLVKTSSAALWDIGDGVACLEFTGKMNSLDPDVLKCIHKSIPVVEQGFKALVIYNEGSNFSVGANLGLALFAANMAAWSQIEELVEKGQQVYKALKYAPFPVVAAPSGMALGGGCEIVLHSDAVQAHAETYIGLVEVGVGLIPGWGGCKEMLARWTEAGAANKAPKGPMPPVAKAFETISVATVAKSAAEAQSNLFLRPTDGVTMNRYRLLADAKARALALAEGYTPPEEPVFRLPGETGRVALEMAVKGFRKLGKATPHDEVVSAALASVLTGGETADMTVELSEDDVLELEREAFNTLLRHPDTLARVEHMLETGKPLRN
ncbi:3-hydroxyacyl-CoA dehydrogenase/enoyl-CoA hydratase family protein [Caenispirillum salinarum]|nr:3-hydroxyacyl-CoA dehydrogenase NAD-binding domain-containing protein [Caenispirillum salinarum]